MTPAGYEPCEARINPRRHQLAPAYAHTVVTSNRCDLPGRPVELCGPLCAVRVVLCRRHRAAMRRAGHWLRWLPKASDQSPLAPGHVATDNGIEVGPLRSAPPCKT